MSPPQAAGDQQTLDDQKETPYTVDIWDSSQVKNVLDETAKQVLLQNYKYEESNFIVDIRLGLCALPVISALIALIYDYLHPFPASESVLKWCVYSYFFLILVLSVYSTCVEPNTIMIGYKKKKGGKKDEIKIMSLMKRFDDKYTLIVEKTPNKKASRTMSVGEWFDVTGLFLQYKFEGFVKTVLKSKSN